MLVTKKAFRHIYNLIYEGVLSEKEAYDLIVGVFEKEYYPVPVPTVVQENPIEEPAKQVEVRGFVNNE